MHFLVSFFKNFCYLSIKYVGICKTDVKITLRLKINFDD